mmetsp:Transcript_21353/g.42411  ORF Transcript_21353/g.42411 Transcript_21353/m.42411 type:complete len:311 (-) Transcript_21353:1164-2096(-)
MDEGGVLLGDGDPVVLQESLCTVQALGGELVVPKRTQKFRNHDVCLRVILRLPEPHIPLHHLDVLPKEMVLVLVLLRALNFPPERLHETLVLLQRNQTKPLGEIDAVSHLCRGVEVCLRSPDGSEGCTHQTPHPCAHDHQHKFLLWIGLLCDLVLHTGFDRLFVLLVLDIVQFEGLVRDGTLLVLDRLHLMLENVPVRVLELFILAQEGQPGLEHVPYVVSVQLKVGDVVVCADGRAASVDLQNNMHPLLHHHEQNPGLCRWEHDGILGVVCEGLFWDDEVFHGLCQPPLNKNRVLGEIWGHFERDGETV